MPKRKMTLEAELDNALGLCWLTTEFYLEGSTP
jgi:hypothetical protein